MDAFVQLALIEKAKRVFAADPGVMLSFPLLAPLGFTAPELAALADPASPSDYLAAADFARAVNVLPRDMLATASERLLWDVYRDVLDRAQVATDPPGGPAPDAPSILYDTAADGSWVESAAMGRYRQYRDAWFVAREAYAARRLTGELAGDPAVRQHWLEVEEPAFRAAVETAARDWDNLGRRAEIETAIPATAGRSPRERWAEWRAAFNPEVDLQVDPTSRSVYAPTGFSPHDFAERGDWASFTLSADEMKVLVTKAPDRLRQLLGGALGEGVRSVSFDYRSVALLRPWFRAEALTSRIWRSDDQDLMLSDGADPPAGACPAYAAACVFVRRVVVVDHDAGKSFAPLRFTLDPRRIQLVHADAAGPAPAAGWRPGIAPAAATPMVNRSRAFAAIRRVSRPALPASAIFSAAAAGVRLPAGTFGATPPPSPPPSPPSQARDELSILALICRRLPKAPDPDPDLRWS